MRAGCPHGALLVSQGQLHIIGMGGARLQTLLILAATVVPCASGGIFERHDGWARSSPRTRHRRDGQQSNPAFPTTPRHDEAEDESGLHRKAHVVDDANEDMEGISEATLKRCETCPAPPTDLLPFLISTAAVLLNNMTYSAQPPIHPHYSGRLAIAVWRRPTGTEQRGFVVAEDVIEDRRTGFPLRALRCRGRL